MPVSDAGSLGRVALLPLASLLLTQFLLVFTGVIPVFEGALVDPDAYMRLNRVVGLHGGAPWFDPTDARVNPPHGHVQHWTRPLDALLLAGAAVLTPVLGFRDALHVWGVLINPLFMAGALIALLWAAAPVLDRRGLILAGFAFALQPIVVSYGSIARPDHHGPMLLMLALATALFPRLIVCPGSARLAWAAGGVMALGIWVSTEALTFAAVGLGTLGLYWLFGTPGIARAGLRLALACTLGLSLAVVLERGTSGWSAVEVDRVSVLHIALFAAIALFWTVAMVADRTRTLATAPARVGAAAVGAVLTAAALYALFPAVGHGPLGAVDPLYRELRLQRIVELEPLVSWSLLTAGEWPRAVSRLLMFAGFILVATPYLLVRLARERGNAHPLWVYLGLGFLLFVPLSFYQIRWLIASELLCVVPYAALLSVGLQGLERALSPRPLIVARPLALAVGLLWALLLPQTLPDNERSTTVIETCPLRDLTRVLADADGGRSGTVLTLPDLGPELLYRTPHSVLSIPNHRPQAGFGATVHALRAQDDAAARVLLDRHGVDWVLLCPGTAERMLYDHERSPPTLYRRLVDGRGPDWLRPVELPPSLATTFALFEVAADDEADTELPTAAGPDTTRAQVE